MPFAERDLAIVAAARDARRATFLLPAAAGLLRAEVIIPRDDCSPSLRRMGEELGKLRDKEKRRSDA
jgi:hypothetical protein